MQKGIFWDTSGWFALLVSSEEKHEKAMKLAEAQIKKKIPFLTSDFVVQETLTLFMARKEFIQGRQFWTNIQESRIIRIECIDEERFQKSGEYFYKHIDQGYSFVDASSFLLMKEFKIADAVTTDKHFTKAGFQILL